MLGETVPESAEGPAGTRRKKQIVVVQFDNFRMFEYLLDYRVSAIPG
jgi:hypothetical protein